MHTYRERLVAEATLIRRAEEAADAVARAMDRHNRVKLRVKTLIQEKVGEYMHVCVHAEGRM